MSAPNRGFLGIPPPLPGRIFCDGGYRWFHHRLISAWPSGPGMASVPGVGRLLAEQNARNEISRGARGVPKCNLGTRGRKAKLLEVHRLRQGKLGLLRMTIF